jgi:hypothetical protein
MTNKRSKKRLIKKEHQLRNKIADKLTRLVNLVETPEDIQELLLALEPVKRSYENVVAVMPSFEKADRVYDPRLSQYIKYKEEFFKLTMYEANKLTTVMAAKMMAFDTESERVEKLKQETIEKFNDIPSNESNDSGTNDVPDGDSSGIADLPPEA